MGDDAAAPAGEVSVAAEDTAAEAIESADEADASETEDRDDEDGDEDDTDYKDYKDDKDDKKAFSDAEFVKKAASGGMHEVELGKLAAAKAKNAGGKVTKASEPKPGKKQ